MVNTRGEFGGFAGKNECFFRGLGAQKIDFLAPKGVPRGKKSDLFSFFVALCGFPVVFLEKKRTAGAKNVIFLDFCRVKNSVNFKSDYFSSFGGIYE